MLRKDAAARGLALNRSAIASTSIGAGSSWPSSTTSAPSSRSLTQTIPCGNTEKNVAISLLTTSAVLS